MRAVLESHWVRHPRVWWVMGGLVWVAILVMSLMSRDPPTQFQPQLYTPEGHPGDVVQMEVPVKRNLDRDCAVESSRTFYDSNHAAEPAGARQHISPEGLRLREKASPGRLLFNIQIPKNASYGTATVITEIQYFCPYNPTTWISQIDDAFPVYINVTPKVTP